MREIKFRAWDKQEKIILPVHSMYFNDEGSCAVVSMIIENPDLKYETSLVREFDNVELMQSTGLNDKNGNPIYEGDIVDTSKIGFEKKYQKATVVYYTYGYHLEIVGQDGLLQELFGEDWSKLEVLGNKFQHPHLLDKEEVVA